MRAMPGSGMAAPRAQEAASQWAFLSALALVVIALLLEGCGDSGTTMMRIDEPAPPSAHTDPTPPTATETKCGGWCKKNAKPWKEKCAWVDCGACPDCDLLPPPPPVVSIGGGWKVGSGTAGSNCVVSPKSQIKLDPNLFGVNDVFGTIITLPYSDSALRTSVQALKPGIMRYPGGTVANYWSMKEGSYVGTEDRAGATHCAVPGDYTFCNFQKKIQRRPPKSFTPERFWNDLGKQAAWGMRQGPMYVLNVLTLTKEQIFEEIDALKAMGVPVTMVELGNELNLEKYLPRVPDANAYAEMCKPVIPKLREAFPGVKLSFVIHTGAGAKGSWNHVLSAYKDLVDAVSVHDYSPSKDMADEYEANGTALAGWGEVRAEFLVQQTSKWWKGKEIWRTEFNYPSWASGPPVAENNLAGSMMGITWASTVLASIKRYNAACPIRALLFYDFAWEPNTKWGPGTYNFIHLPKEENSPDDVRVNGAGQIFAHLTRAALVKANFRMWPLTLTAETCGSAFHVLGNVGGQEAPCLEAAGFSPNWKQPPAYAASSIAVVNHCGQHEIVLDFSELMPIDAAAGFEVVATHYLATDNGGWAPLPSDPSVLPWTTGPLTPTISRFEAVKDQLDEIKVTLPPASFSIVSVEPIGQFISSKWSTSDLLEASTSLASAGLGVGAALLAVVAASSLALLVVARRLPAFRTGRPLDAERSSSRSLFLDVDDSREEGCAE